MLPELEALGCDAAQGYAISHPLAAPDVTRWMLDFRSTSGIERAVAARRYQRSDRPA